MNLVLALVVLGVGATAVWAGIADPEGGVVEGLRRALDDEPITKRSSAVSAGFIAQAAALGSSSSAGSSSAASVAFDGGGTGTPAAGARAQVLSEARTWLGVPYRWGGNTRAGVDCSGLTVAVYKTVGVNLPRVSAAQALVGRKIPQAQAQPGDLVFFGIPVHHVGIYTGADTLLHSPRPGRAVVEESVWHSEPIQFRNVLDGATPDTPPTKARKPRKKRKPGTVNV